MIATQTSFEVLCDDLSLPCGAVVPDDPRGSVVLLHGIPSTAPPDPTDEGYPGLAKRFAQRGWTATWVDMRAARGAPGYFSIEGWVRDAQATIEATARLPGLDDKPLAVLGSSAGGAVATEVVARGARADALVLLAAVATWSLIEEDPHLGVARVTGDAGMVLAEDVVADPTSWSQEFRGVTAEESIARVEIPILIVHGTADDVVPVDHARRIAARAPAARVEIIEGAPHQLRRHPGVFEMVASWLEDTLLGHR